jgi:hypothetical protein
MLEASNFMRTARCQFRFVIKTVDTANGRKVFINVCGSLQVPAPGGWSAAAVPERVARVLDDLNREAPGAIEEAEEVLRFPLSAGPLRSDTDRSGAPCSVADCVLNSAVLTASEGHRPLKAFLIEVLLGHVAEKHKLSLDSRFKLPSMRYKGASVQAQRLRKERKALVTELREEGMLPKEAQPSTSAPLQARHASSMLGSNKTPEAMPLGGPPVVATMQAATRNGQPLAGSPPQQEGSATQLRASIHCTSRPVQEVMVQAQLPTAGAWKRLCSNSTADALVQDTVVEVGGPRSDVLYLSVPGCGLLDVKLPFSVSGAGARAELRLAEEPHSCPSTIVVTLPVVPVGRILGQIAAQCPGRFSASLATSAAHYMELE